MSAGGAKSTDAAMATMTDCPFVNHVPVMTGGVGSDDVRRFYSTYFIPDIRRTFG
jgi:carboxymethylenebutenolidase